MTETRRLAAILAADVVGYSRLMGEDEAGQGHPLAPRSKAPNCAVRHIRCCTVEALSIARRRQNRGSRPMSTIRVWRHSWPLTVISLGVVLSFGWVAVWFWLLLHLVA
jgi:hypothetical protein